MRILYLLLLVFSGLLIHAQIDSSSLTLDEVVITSYQKEKNSESSLNIQGIPVNTGSTSGTFSISDVLSSQPGLDVIGTGNAISKPVLRGAYGSRLLVLISGLKFDNQEWQDEHGLGLPSMGLERVEVVRGPMSVLYGSEAIGGLINTIEEGAPRVGTREQDLSVSLNSNTLGGQLQYGIRENLGQSWWRLRIGVENNGDYSDGNSNRVLNSRYDGYYLKASYGFTKESWTSTNHFMSTANRFGFIFNGVYNFIEPDARWSRQLGENPAHLVFLNLLSSENEIRLPNGDVLNLRIGIQSNERMENEGSGAISLNMHLFTAQSLARYQVQLSENHNLTLSNLLSYEHNINFGARKIVPNAHLFESNLSAYSKYRITDQLTWENGINFGTKYISTLPTPTVNSSDKELTPFKVNKPYANGMTGIVFRPSINWLMKLNAATGVRVPNLAELSADGLHEGIYTYEIGNPNLKNEHSVALNAEATFTRGNWQLFITPFYSRYYDYIYLAPTMEEWFGFPVYRYRQQNSNQYGTEAGVRYGTDQNHLNVSYENVVNRLDDGSYTPFLPAQKIKSSLRFSFPYFGGDTHINVEGIYCFDQNKTALNESPTTDYFLLNAGLEYRWNKRHEFILKVDNLTNTAYQSHLSRLKNYGILNMGRNINLTYAYSF